jgi:hypothetical protein
MSDIIIVNYIPKTNYVGNLYIKYINVENNNVKKNLIKKDDNFNAIKNGEIFYTILVKKKIYDEIENKLNFIENIINKKTNDYIAFLKKENSNIEYYYYIDTDVIQQYEYKKILDSNLYFINSQILF